MPARVRWVKPTLAGLVLLGAVAVAWVGAHYRPQPAATPRTDPASDPGFAKVLVSAPVAVAPGVYLLGKMHPAAAYAVETSDGLVLVDSGLEASAATLTSQLASLRLDVGRLRAILLTHVHADHSLGAQRLRGQTGAKIYAGSGDCAPLREGKPRDAIFSTYYMPEVPTHPTTVDVELKGGEQLEFGDTRFEVIATPGHTPGSVCYLMTRAGLRAMFTGDVIQQLGLGKGVPLGTYTAYLPPRYRGDARDFLGSLKRLRLMPVPDLILPGHPRSDTPSQSPHLSQQRWTQILDEGVAEMETLVTRYEADGANFLDDNPKELLPGLRYLGDCGGKPVYCLEAPKGLVLFDAPGGAELVDFLARRFKELGWEGRKPAAVVLTSAGAEATAGLAALVQNTGCRVVAPKAGLKAVEALCPAGTQVVDEDGLDLVGGFAAKPIALGGCGVAPLAYQFQWAGKTVLVSGRIPVKVTLPSADKLLSDVGGPGGDRVAYLKSLDRLAEVNPAVWLPAVPINGQNANLYDDDWAEVLKGNRVLFEEPRPEK